MKKIKRLIDIIIKVISILDKRQKNKFVLVLLLTIICSLFQLLGVSALVPVFDAFLNPQEFQKIQYVQAVNHIFHIDSYNKLVAILSASVVVLYLVKNIISTLHVWISYKYSCLVEREISVRLMKAYMNKSYDYFLNHNTAELQRDICLDAQSMHFILNSIISIICEFLTVIMIFCYMILSEWKMAVFVLLIAGVALFFSLRFFRRIVNDSGLVFRRELANHNKVFLEAVEGIKEVMVMNKQRFFVSQYEETYSSYQKPGIIQRVASTSPTFFIEALFVSGIMIYLCINSYVNPNFYSMMPVWASFAVAAIRMLPSLGRISSNANTVAYYIPSLNSLYKVINNNRSVNDLDNTNLQRVVFNKSVEIKNVTWTYEGGNKKVLDNISLQIDKGKAVGIIGQSGAGKSTFVDILLGLHSIKKGEILIDGVDITKNMASWRDIIGYVSQSIYLVDGTIKENIGFGLADSEIDEELVWRVLEQAQIADFVKELPDGIDTVIGERGVRISGGQRQRIAIARAMFRKPEILVLDEATSALDNETEASLMKTIESLYGSMTMIIIAHRLTTVRRCHEVYELVDGKLIRSDNLDFG